jgi:peptidoglycan/xylan/chitin deacetylase (PgdA/CDA1 family)
VTYHGVIPAGYESRNSALDGNLVDADSMRRQLALLKKNYCVIAPAHFLGWIAGEMSLPPRSILLTCDDALRNTLTEMLPILRDLGLSCLFFATGAAAEETPSMLWYEELYLMMLDADGPIALSIPDAGLNVRSVSSNARHSCWWDLVQQLSRFDRELRRRFLDQIRGQLGLLEQWSDRYVEDPIFAARFLSLNVAELRQLAAAGMTIGAHSLSHPVLSRSSKELAWQEISESRSVLERALGKTVWAFAYPFGNAATVSRRDVQLAEDAGFRCAFMNAGGGFGAKIGAREQVKINRFVLPRVHVTAEMTLGEFEAHVSGFYRSLRQRLKGEGEAEGGVGE